MAFQLQRPLVTVSCHEDLTSSDLVGRFLLEGAETVWQDGPLTRAVKAGAICYLDEIVEARTDSTVVIHSLTDHRRKLTIEKKGQEIDAHEDFILVISYNPGYQTVLKDLKPSTKQRFIAINFDFPSEEIERKVVLNEAAGISPEIVHHLVAAGRKARLLKDHGLEEATSTRALVYAANMRVSALRSAFTRFARLVWSAMRRCASPSAVSTPFDCSGVAITGMRARSSLSCAAMSATTRIQSDLRTVSIRSAPEQA